MVACKGGENVAGNSESGRKYDQKMKPFLIYQYLMRYSDENNVVKTTKIIEYLKTCEISAERRSIYKDIAEINKAILLAEGVTIDVLEAEELCEDDEECTIVYDKHRKGFYVRHRHYEVEDIRMLAECVYAARFIDEKRARRLVDVVCDHVSDRAAETIKHDVFLTDRVKTESTLVYTNVSLIHNAMSRELDGEKHVPEKIKFKYLKCTIQNVKNRVERRGGAEYVVSPYKLMINDGNYYLLAFDDKIKKMRTFRVDRMKSVRFTGEPRQGREEYEKINMESYAQEHFGMFGGAREHVTLRFIEPLLDTVVDRFGTKGAVYSKDDDRHFQVTVSVEVSDQFFAWLCGFGRRVKIVSPEPVKEKFKAHLDKMRGMYE